MLTFNSSYIATCSRTNDSLIAHTDKPWFNRM